MYIQPNSTIKLLHDVPIDPNQTDTVFFETPTEQLAYFNQKVVMTFPENTYQRVQRGYCRLNVLADRVYDVNYMMFQNTNYSNKWFYAFVDSVEYINDNTTEIQFTIDPIQTWFFEYEVDECFVERETTFSDEIGEHIEPEKPNEGEYVINGEYTYLGNRFGDMCMVVVYDDPDETKAYLYDGVFTGGELLAFEANTSGQTALQDFIDSQVAHPESIVNIYMCPKALLGTISPDHKIPYNKSASKFGTNIPSITDTDSLDGYIPFNRKMYTYPYNFYHVDTPSGQSLDVRYEFFKNLKPKFEISGNVTTPVELVCIPTDYKNASGSGSTFGTEYRPERLSIKGFPICNWSTDYYASWFAQNSVPRIIGGATTLAVGSALGNPVVAGVGVASVGNMLSDMYKSSIHADITKGSYDTGSNDFSADRMRFMGSRMSVTHQYAKRIDDYFTAFGYSVGRVKRPNRRLRTRFTYVKTIGAIISGRLPSSDAKTIADCYDRGIRFWRDHTNILNYQIRNVPLAEADQS